MSQLNVNPGYEPSRDEASRAAISNNLTWAIGMVLVIAALAIAIVYVAHNVRM